MLTLWGDIDAKEVSSETMARAIDLAQFYLSEAKRLAETATISAQTDQAEKLRNWILSSWPDKARTMGRDPGQSCRVTSSRTDLARCGKPGP